MPQLGEIKRGKELGIKDKNNLFIWSACISCGKERWVAFKRGANTPRSKRCHKCGQLIAAKKRIGFHRGDKHLGWKGGRLITSDGYIIVFCLPDSPFYPMAVAKDRGRGTAYVLEHRLTMAKHLGRCLTSNEIVHHIDGDRSNNKLENLRLTDKNNHKLRYGQAYNDGYKKGYTQGLADARGC